MKNLLNRIFNLNGTLRGDMEWIGDSTDTIPIAVNATATVYSKIFPIYTAQNLGIAFICSGTTVSVTITVEQGPVPPATANINSADTNFAVGSGVAAVCTNLSSKTMQIQTLSLVPMKWARLKIVGTGSNSSDVTIKFGLFIQEFPA